MKEAAHQQGHAAAEYQILLLVVNITDDLLDTLAVWNARIQAFRQIEHRHVTHARTIITCLDVLKKAPSITSDETEPVILLIRILIGDIISEG